MDTSVIQVGLGLSVLIGVVMAAIVLLPATNAIRGWLYDLALPALEIALTRDNGGSFQPRETRNNMSRLTERML
jgi:hypothetical protein